MFIKIVNSQIAKKLNSIQELREEFKHISFPSDEEFIELKYKVTLPSFWYYEESKEAKKLLNRT